MLQVHNAAEMATLTDDKPPQSRLLCLIAWKNENKFHKEIAVSKRKYWRSVICK